MARWRWYLLVLALLALAPWLLPTYLQTNLTEILILGLFAMSLDLLVGYTRLISFGHAAAYGLGAYSCAYALVHWDVPLLVALAFTVVFCALLAVPISWVLTQATGVAFAMLTLAYAQLLYAVAFRWQSVTGGSDGMAGIPRTPGPFGLDLFSSRMGYFYLVLGLLAIAFVLCRKFVASPCGAVLRGVRENEAKTRALGYNTRLYKMGAVVAAYTVGGLAGGLYAAFAGFASPPLLFWLVSGQVLVMVIVGGAGTLIGPILGAAFFVTMEHQLSAITDMWALIFGLIFIAFILFAPQGIWGLVLDIERRRTRKPEVSGDEFQVGGG